MNKKLIRTTSAGIRCPMIKEGDNIIDIVSDAVLNATFVKTSYKNISDSETKSGLYTKAVKKYSIKDNDVIGITESVVARSAGLYITIDDIANDIVYKFGDNPTVALISPIYSRNRFAMILKGIARACKKVVMYMPDVDEVGNPRGVNPFTGVNIEEYYRELCKNENCEFDVIYELRSIRNENPSLSRRGIDMIDYPIDGYIDCSLHLHSNTSPLMIHSWYRFYPCYTLYDICSDFNPDFGVLGTNKSTEERLKLFPTKALADKVCREVKKKIKEETGKNVFVMIFGDGHFHSPMLPGIPNSSILEFADPLAWLSSKEDECIFNSTPNEVKLKSLIDESKSEKEIKEVLKKNNGQNLVGNMTSMGTTPRHIGDLIATNFDTLVGSGSKGCPVCLLSGYFDNLSNNF